MMKVQWTIALILCLTTIFCFANDAALAVFEQYLEAFLTGDYQRAEEMQNEKMSTAFGIQAMEQSANVIVNQYGKPEITYSTDLKEQGDYKTYIRLMGTTKGAIKFSVTVDKDLKIAGFFAAPAPDPRKSLSYVDQKSFEEQWIQFGQPGWELDGMLTIPINKDSYPVVILVGGSGPTDMDGSVGANTPYKDIAEGLASSGIAVMRYNKRGAQHGQKMTNIADEIENMIDVEYVEDIISAIEFASKLEGAQNLILAGHSLGGSVVPKIAVRSEKVDGLILLAPGIRRLAQISLDQNLYAKDHLGISDEQMAQVEAFYQLILNHELEKDYPIQAGLMADYYYQWDDYRPLEDLEDYDKPVLVIQGEEDFQATMEGDFLPFKEKYGEVQNYTFRSFPALNHLLVKTEQGVFHWTDDYNKAGFVDEAVIKTLSEWIDLHF